MNPPAGAYMWDSEIGIWVKPGMLFDDGKAAWMEKVGGTWKEVPGGQLVPPKPVVVEPVGPVGAVDTGRRALGREFFNEEEGNMWASVNWPNSSGYSAAEQRAMMSYTESGFRETNRALRNSGGLTGGVKAMDSAFLTAPALAEPIVVTRGATLAEFGLGRGENPSVNANGSCSIRNAKAARKRM